MIPNSRSRESLFLVPRLRQRTSIYLAWLDLSFQENFFLREPCSATLPQKTVKLPNAFHGAHHQTRLPALSLNTLSTKVLLALAMDKAKQPTVTVTFTQHLRTGLGPLGVIAIPALQRRQHQ